jgi:DNA-binding FadR family transcriptional regulator
MAASDVLSTPLHVAPAYAAVVDRLRRSIALGVVLPGEKLPPERTLAENLGVSRVTVREALRVLQGEGLIVTKRGGTGGAVITSREFSLERIRREFRPQIDHVFEYRLAVEAMAARLAAERRDDADIGHLVANQEALVASEDIGAFRRADSAFHLAIADASRNPMLRQSIEDARTIIFDSFDVLPYRVLRESSAAGHAAIIAAIEGGRTDAASDAMADHLHQAHDEVVAVLFDGE